MEHKIYPNVSIGKNAVIEEYVIIGVPPRGKKPGERNPLTVENVRLTRENLHLKNRLKQAETIIDVQKKWPSS